MKAILLSIRPEWTAKILNGQKTIEIRKSRPKCDLPVTVYIYCTFGQELIKIGDAIGIAHILGVNKDVISKVDKRTINSNYRLNGKIVAKFTLGKINEKRNIIEGLETLKCIDQIPNIKSENGETYIDGYINTEPFYNGKVATINVSCLTQKELIAYGKGKPLYAWHISDLVVFDKPNELGVFYTRCKNSANCNDCEEHEKAYFPEYIYEACTGFGLKPLTRPPQSYQFVEVDKC